MMTGSKEGEKHPLSGWEEHSPLNVGQCFFFPVDSETQKAGYESQAKCLDRVETRQHEWTSHGEITPRQDLLDNIR